MSLRWNCSQKDTIINLDLNADVTCRSEALTTIFRRSAAKVTSSRKWRKFLRAGGGAGNHRAILARSTRARSPGGDQNFRWDKALQAAAAIEDEHLIPNFQNNHGAMRDTTQLDPESRHYRSSSLKLIDETLDLVLDGVVL